MGQRRSHRRRRRDRGHGTSRWNQRGGACGDGLSPQLETAPERLGGSDCGLATGLEICGGLHGGEHVSHERDQRCHRRLGVEHLPGYLAQLRTVLLERARLCMHRSSTKHFRGHPSDHRCARHDICAEGRYQGVQALICVHGRASNLGDPDDSQIGRSFATLAELASPSGHSQCTRRWAACTSVAVVGFPRATRDLREAMAQPARAPGSPRYGAPAACAYRPTPGC